jgi:hypothetical protein
MYQSTRIVIREIAQEEGVTEDEALRLYLHPKSACSVCGKEVATESSYINDMGIILCTECCAEQQRVLGG